MSRHPVNFGPQTRWAIGLALLLLLVIIIAFAREPLNPPSAPQPRGLRQDRMPEGDARMGQGPLANGGIYSPGSAGKGQGSWQRQEH